MAPPQLLLVEDDPQLVRAVAPALEVCGLRVTVVAVDGTSAIAHLDNGTQDAVAVDLGLPDMDARCYSALQQTAGTAPDPSAGMRISSPLVQPLKILAHRRSRAVLLDLE